MSRIRHPRLRVVERSGDAKRKAGPARQAAGSVTGTGPRADDVVLCRRRPIEAPQATKKLVVDALMAMHMPINFFTDSSFGIPFGGVDEG